MKLSELEYDTLDGCKCGQEEFFVLASGVKEYEIPELVRALYRLVEQKCLSWSRGRGKPPWSNQPLPKGSLQEYVAVRQAAGEVLSEYPSVCDEYKFWTTEHGITFLRDEDKPISHEERERERRERSEGQ